MWHTSPPPERASGTVRAPRPGRRNKAIVLTICCFSLFIVGLDNTVVNLALPTIQHDLHADVSELQWTLDAYMLAVASLVVLSGSTGDRFGRRRTFLAGLTTFGLGSLLCSIAPNAGLLIAFRAVQGAGGSLMTPSALSIISSVFTNPRDRVRAIGVWSSVTGFSMAIGPLAGGLLVDVAGWRSIFWLNVPLVIIVAGLSRIFTPESMALRPGRFDPVGQILVVVALTSLTFGIIEGRVIGWGSPVIVTCLALAGVTTAALIAYERRRHEPLLELRFFASIPFSGATLIAVWSFCAWSGFIFINALYLQNVRGLSPFHAGLLTLPVAAMVVVSSPIAGRIVARRGPRLPLVVSGLGIALAGLLLTQITAHTSTGYLLAAYALFGIGFGFVNAPITNAAVTGMPQAQAGMAAAVATASRQVGACLGVAVLGSVTAVDLRSAVDSATAVGQAAWWITVCCGCAVLLLGVFTTGHRAHASARRILGATQPAGLREHVATGGGRDQASVRLPESTRVPRE
ncbi:MFS transporter [Lentzea flava]|uniref:MFS transporter n=1 Tax=Lentzea flava TaxID=103732 RepID=UPI001E5194A7|nr:MFS transporter [Lentzea flava]